MIRGIKEWAGGLLAALRGIEGAAHALFTLHAEAPAGSEDPRVAALLERVDQLERTRALWEAEVEGLLTKAEAETRKARNAEERTRRLARQASDDAEEGDEGSVDDIAAQYAAFLAANGVAGEAPPVQPVPAGVAVHGTRLSIARKWGYGG